MDELRYEVMALQVVMQHIVFTLDANGVLDRFALAEKLRVERPGEIAATRSALNQIAEWMTMEPERAPWLQGVIEGGKREDDEPSAG